MEPIRELKLLVMPLVLAEGVYKVLYSLLGGGEFIKSVGEEYQVVKRGKEYHGYGKE